MHELGADRNRLALLRVGDVPAARMTNADLLTWPELNTTRLLIADSRSVGIRRTVIATRAIATTTRQRSGGQAGLPGRFNFQPRGTRSAVTAESSSEKRRPDWSSNRCAAMNARQRADTVFTSAGAVKPPPIR